MDPVVAALVLAGLAAVAGPLALLRGLRVPDPFLDPRLFRHRPFAAAAVVSALTGTGSPRRSWRRGVRGPRPVRRSRRAALRARALGLATAVGALVSGFAVRLCRCAS